MKRNRCLKLNSSSKSVTTNPPPPPSYSSSFGSRHRAVGRGFDSSLCLGCLSSLISHVTITGSPNLAQLMYTKVTRTSSSSYAFLIPHRNVMQVINQLCSLLWDIYLHIYRKWKVDMKNNLNIFLVIFYIHTHIHSSRFYTVFAQYCIHKGYDVGLTFCLRSFFSMISEKYKITSL